jgi:outer membrane protein TolC
VRYNVAKAEVDVANARIASLRATDAVRAGLLQLEATLGVRLGARFALADTLAANADTLGLDSAVATALAARPELIAARLRQDAAAAQLAAAHLARLPAISGSAGYGLQSADSADQWTQSWNVGVNLTLPLFLGGSLTGAITQARGSQAVAQALVVGLEQSVTTEVELQTSALGEARERLAAATEAVGLAQLALQLAQECYRAGSGSALEMSDSELALTNAKLARIQALADCATARARLAHAMGALNVASGR